MGQTAAKKDWWGALFIVLPVSLVGVAPLQAATFYVAPPPLGCDCHNVVEAQSPTKPWATLNKASSETSAGDTVVVMPGVYQETLKPKRTHMIWRAEPRRQAILQPPSGQGVLVENLEGTTVEGFVVKGVTTGISFVTADTGIVRDNVVYGHSVHGISFSQSTGGVIENNVVHTNGDMGIRHLAGTDGIVRNNLVYNNGGLVPSGGWGISLEDNLGSNNRIETNTVDRNRRGVRIQSGVGQIVNNIITNSLGVGLKNADPAQIEDDYNNATGNTPDFDFPTGIFPGEHTLSADPLYVDPDGTDNLLGGANWEDDSYHLSQIPAGQSADSPSVNTGDPSVVVSGSTATDRLLDGVSGDQNDMGYHYPELQATMQQFVLTNVKTTVATKQGQTTASYNLKGTMVLGPNSNGIDPANERVRVEINSSNHIFNVGTCRILKDMVAAQCDSSNPQVSVKIVGTGAFEIIAKNLPIPPLPLLNKVRLVLFIGNDVGTTEKDYIRGTLKAP
jgi:parallel beta-helix repeat protein